MIRTMATLAVMLTVMVTAGMAGTYDVNVTRKDADLYEVTGGEFLITTQFCFEFVYFSDAILRTNGALNGKLIFVDDGGSCDVTGVFSKQTVSPGRYSVRVTRKADNWYGVQGVNTYLRTSLCLSLAIGQSAVLEMVGQVYGTLYFSEYSQCTVEGVYGRLKQ